MKRAVIFVLVIMLCLSFAGCNDELSKEDVFSLVNDNKDTILQDVSEGDFSDCKKIAEIKEITKYDNFVEFYCGGKGMGGETSYCGFYYFANDDLQAVLDELAQLIGGADTDVEFTVDCNGYIWRAAEGDNSLYVEKIDNNLYYYYQSY